MRKKQKRSSNKGFTLIELMVGLALWMMIAVTVINLFHSSLRLWKQTEKAAPLQQEARVVLNQIAREFRNLIDVPGVGWTVSDHAIAFATLEEDKIEKVSYRLSPVQGGNILYRSRQWLTPSGSVPPIETPMTAHPTVINWEYAYMAPQGQVEWKDAWRPAPNDPLPGGIRVRLTLIDDAGLPEVYTRTLFAPAARTIPWAK